MGRRRLSSSFFFNNERAVLREVLRRVEIIRRGCVLVHEIRMGASNGVPWRRVLPQVRKLRI